VLFTIWCADIASNVDINDRSGSGFGNFYVLSLHGSSFSIQGLVVWEEGREGVCKLDGILTSAKTIPPGYIDHSDLVAPLGTEVLVANLALHCNHRKRINCSAVKGMVRRLEDLLKRHIGDIQLRAALFCFGLASRLPQALCGRLGHTVWMDHG
jgi:hypothetical protein